MMKKLLLFNLLLFLSIMASRAAYEIDGIYYNLNSNSKTAEVSSGTDMYTGSVTIPMYVSYGGIDYSVTSIGSNAFRNCSNLTAVSLCDNVTTIGNNAFLGCTGLTSFTIPTSVKSIGGAAFEGCSGLTSVTIPSSVTSIGYYAFQKCI